MLTSGKTAPEEDDLPTGKQLRSFLGYCAKKGEEEMLRWSSSHVIMFCRERNIVAIRT
jgi:hypothetical protein